MKRAIEEMLLAPLALTIVNHNFPEGDQFLFVRQHGNSLKVDFVDPEAPKTNWKGKAQKVKSQQAKADELTLNKIILDAKGLLSEREAIRREWETFEKEVANAALESTKDELMEELSSTDFWSRDDRHLTLGDIEFIDRFQHSYSTLQSLMERIADEGKPKLQFPADLLQRIADRLRLMQLALGAYLDEQAQDCYLCLSINDDDVDGEAASAFMDRLKSMYKHWAGRCKMHVKKVHESKGEVAFLITGFGANQILQHETGIHVWNTPAAKAGDTDRIRIRVNCISCENPATELADQSKQFQALRKEQSQAITAIARSYREAPKKLVKDHIAGWRSGRLQVIMNGMFDLMGG